LTCINQEFCTASQMLQLDVKLLAAGAYSLEELTSREDILRKIFEGATVQVGHGATMSE